jgi:hypothetical protein
MTDKNLMMTEQQAMLDEARRHYYSVVSEMFCTNLETVMSAW